MTAGDGNLDPMGVDESSVIDRIATNRRICELESQVEAARGVAALWRDEAHRLWCEKHGIDRSRYRLLLPWEAS